MEGNWIATVDWGAIDDPRQPWVMLAEPAAKSAAEPAAKPAGALSDAARIVSGDRGAILAGELELPGGRAGCARDLLDEYHRRGRSYFRHLRGRFVAMIWDGARRNLIALRDPMGVYPLFVSSRRGGMLLSPSIERLVEQGGAGPSIDRVALAEHLWHRWPDKQRTYFEGVRRIPAGHVLEATEAGEVLDRYWDPAAESDSGRAERAARLGPAELERFEDLFDRAIRRCSARKRTGIFLSGGLDSVSIASRLAESSSAASRPLGLSLAFRHPSCDESEIQITVARRLGLQHEVREVPSRRGAAGPLELARRLTSGWPVPLMNVWNGEFYGLAEAGSRRRCEVILTGSGGDDWLGVSPYYAADLLSSARLRTLARLVGGMRASHGVSAPAAARLALWDFGARAVLRRALGGILRATAPQLDRRLRRIRARRACPSWLAPGRELRQQLLEHGRSRAAGGVTESFYVREMRRGLDHPLLGLELEESFEMGRRLGIQFAHPFLDPDLVAYLYRLPPEGLVGSGGPDRALVRDGLASRFPDLGFDRQRKSDARQFFAELARAEGVRIWRRLGGPRALEELGIVDGRGVAVEIGAMLSSTNEATGLFRLWDLINLEQWLRQRCA